MRNEDTSRAAHESVEVEVRIQLSEPEINHQDDQESEAPNGGESAVSETDFHGFQDAPDEIGSDNDDNDNESVVSETDFCGVHNQQTPRRSQRLTKGIPPRRLVLRAESEEVKEPKTFTEATASPLKAAWYSVMQEELESIEANETWDLVDLPAGRKPIGSKWVYKIKRSAVGEVICYKARLVAQGYSQQYDTDYDQIFAPVVRHTTFRTLLAVAA